MRDQLKQFISVLFLPFVAAGTCTVFGDPHYKTFDGKFFSFQGSCKYQLTADCVDHTFSIRVTNNDRNTRLASWTKTVTLKMNSLKVNLGQKMRVKVNGTRIIPPYKLDNVVDIQKTDEGIRVTTEIGINILWDGSSFLQVQASTAYKQKLCGLCGNYNSVFRDDLMSRRGINYSDGDVWRFANSWKVGGQKACSRKHENLAKMSTVCRHKRGWHMCKPLNDSEAFDACGSRLNPFHYYEACKKDMCECPDGKCYCDAFAAYAHECKRVGVQMTDSWKYVTGCSNRNSTAIVGTIQPSTALMSTSFDVNQKTRRRRKKKKKTQQESHQEFLSKHVPISFLYQKPRNNFGTPPPLQ